jgi:MFS family permease
MVRMIFTPALSFIIEEYQITYTQAGTLATAVFWAYAGMQFPAGILGDRLGRKPVLCLGILSWSILCILTSMAYSLTVLFLLRLLTGLAEGSYFGNDRAIISSFTPKERWGIAQGVSMTGAGIGNFLGFFLGGLVAEAWGWRYIFIFVGLGSLAISMLFLKFIPGSSVDSKDASKRDRSEVKVPLWNLFIHKDLWIMYYIGFAVMVIFWIFGIWTPSILLDMGIVSKKASSLYASIFAFCGIPSMVLAGWASDSMLKKRGMERKWGLSFSLFLTMALVFFTGYSVEHRLNFLIFSILIGTSGFLVSSLFPPLYAMIAEASSPGILGATFGFFNFIAFLGAILAPIVAGSIKDLTDSFAWSFYLGASILGIAALLALFVSSPRAGSAKAA